MIELIPILELFNQFLVLMAHKTIKQLNFNFLFIKYFKKKLEF